ncbi:MAG: hypothetical protein ACRECR_02100, partial [Thermoplasmata archaeon]
MAAAASHLPPSPPELERLKALVGRHFPIYETRFTPYSVVFLVHADPDRVAVPFDTLRQELWPLFYVPQIRLERAEYIVEVVRRPPQQAWGIFVNLALLAATIVSTVVAGGFLWVSY